MSISTILIAQKPTDNFSGKWRTSDGTTIEISKSGSLFNGKTKDKNILILRDLTYTNGKWIGVLNNPQKNITVNCEAYLEANKIKFLVKKGLITKEVFWTKES